MGSAVIGLNGPDVYALAVSGTDLYAGGKFTMAGGTEANHVAKWNGRSWSALGLGMGGRFSSEVQVNALAVSGTDLYAGGNFETAGGTAAKSIAKWNGTAWSVLGSGISGSVHALAISGHDLYAGGRFTTAGGTAANYIAKWDGTAWSALGSGVGGLYLSPVYALAVSGTDLYVGGDFKTAGGTTASYIAKWNGAAWSALGSGISDIVYALAISGADLYAGGSFSTAGGANAGNIAKWNGVVWTNLALGLRGTVKTVSLSGTDLYAGGWFDQAGEAPANHIARWDGSGWSTLGSGVATAGRYSHSVSALSVSGTDLYAGGSFTIAGSKASTYVAKAILSLGPGGGLAKTITVFSSIPTIVFEGSPGLPYDVQRTPSLNAPVVWTTLTASSPLTPGADGLFSFTDPNAPAGTAYYRSGPR
jgi:hypothetical protein